MIGFPADLLPQYGAEQVAERCGGSLALVSVTSRSSLAYARPGLLDGAKTPEWPGLIYEHNLTQLIGKTQKHASSSDPLLRSFTNGSPKRASPTAPEAGLEA